MRKNNGRKVFSLIALSSVLILAFSCGNEELLFRDLDVEEAGIDFRNDLTESDDFNILDYLYFYNGGGVAIGDINSDGLPDIFFSGNQVKNRLYLNQGNLSFKDVTDEAGVGGNSDWNTGAVMADVNGDGWLDIYVCAVVGIRGLGGFNELYINNGDGTFAESAARYGLDFDSYSSSAAFLDYDLDGDLDIFLLNHAVHTQESFGHASLRNKRVYETGDKLLRNEGGEFQDVSEAAGIFGGVNGYGLGISVSDFDQNGYPDLYVGNDFHEDDYFYLNNGDGTFSEKLREYFTQTTRFSMGNDAADINHDGLPDLISLDMLPEDETILKRSEGDDELNIMRLRINRYGYHYQFSRNMLQINGDEGFFQESALMSNVAATDWSWSAFFADFNLDGEQDLFVSNGIPRRPNDLDYIRFVSSDQIKNRMDATKLVDQRALEMMPEGAVPNYIFEGGANLVFRDRSKEWMDAKPTFSTATAMADLDNDGDLDLVINNVNDKPSILENKTNNSGNYLKIELRDSAPNSHAIGAKIYAYQGGRLHYRENFNVRGFQSSSEPLIHFGFGEATAVDSIRIVWPKGQIALLKDVATNQTLELEPGALQTGPSVRRPDSKEAFRKIDGNLGIDFVHKEDRYIDFDRQQLMPYQISDRGPATAIGDIDGDGRMDIFFGGSKFVSSKVYIQDNSGFVPADFPQISSDSVQEDVAAAIKDFNSDGKNDLILGSGGGDFFGEMEPLLDSYWLQLDSGFARADFPKAYENASVIATGDYDEDGDIDVFIGNQAVTNDFGRLPDSYLLENRYGNFTLSEKVDLSGFGMVTDAIWVDYDDDGDQDLVVVGEWMSPMVMINENGTFSPLELGKGLRGLWQAVVATDIDNDGDLDFVLGNWGLNSKYKASLKYPLRLYYADFDKNGSTETIVAVEKNGKYYPIESFNALASQMVGLRKKYPAYKDFAGKTVTQLLAENKMKADEILEVETLASGLLRNQEGSFRFEAFGWDLQLAPIMSLLCYDFDKDGAQEVLAAGNYFGLKPNLGRLGSFSGAIITDADKYLSGHSIGLDFKNKSVRSLKMIEKGDKSYLLVTVNNGPVEVYEFLGL